MIKIFSYTLLSVIAVDLLATSGDITATWTSPVFVKLEQNDSTINPIGRPITPGEESWIGAMLTIGAMIGAFPFSFISEKFGRKIALLCIAVPHIISYITMAFSQSVYLFYFGRLLGGLAVGGGYALLPMYVAEISEDSNRGMYSATLNIFWTFGNLISYVIGPFMSIMWFNLALACVPITFLLMFLLLAPETPYYLVKHNKLRLAEDSLMKLRSQSRAVVRKEVEHIQLVLANDEESHFMDLFRSRVYLKALGISIMLIVSQQLCGINAVFFYTQQIFQASGDTNIPDYIGAIIVGLVAFVTSLAVPFFVDRLGRRPLMMASLVLNGISLVMLGLFFYMQKRDVDSVKSFTFLPIISLVLYIFTFTFGVGPIPWTVSSELFPANVKPIAASLISIVSWGFSFLVTYFFTQLRMTLGTGVTFWLFAASAFIVAGLTFFLLPETKGKSFKEIQKILENKKDCDK